MRLFTPREAWSVTTAQHGLRVVPYDADMLYEFMDLEYRVVGRDGVQVDYVKYDGEVLDPIRGRKCPVTGTREWPVRRDRYDVRFVYVNLKAGTSEPAEWVRVPWVHLPPGTAFPLPERLMRFVRTHVGVKQNAGDDIEWVECEDVAGRHTSEEAISKAMGGTMSDYLEWLSGYRARTLRRPEERSEVDAVLAFVIDSARLAVRSRAKEARIANARAMAAMETSAGQAGEEARVDELDPPPTSVAEWDATQTPIFH
jgi:hypothetical protein